MNSAQPEKDQFEEHDSESSQSLNDVPEHSAGDPGASFRRDDSDDSAQSPSLSSANSDCEDRDVDDEGSEVEQPEEITRDSIVTLSIVIFLVGSGLALLGYWLTGRSPAALMPRSGASVMTGVLIAVPAVLLLSVLRILPFGWARDLWDLPREILGPGMVELSVLDVASVSVMAGVSEELLFRGFLQSWLGGFGLLWGLLVPNLLFGLLHAMSVAYAVGAFCAGLCFSCLLEFSGRVDLTSLMTAHAVYDFVAWQWLARSVRRRSAVG